MRKEKLLANIKDTSLVIIGSLILAFGAAVFFIPNEIVSGGSSGIAIIFHALFQWDESITILVLTWSLFVIGFLVLGKKFALQTLCSSIVYPCGIALFSYIYKQYDFLHLQSSAILGSELANINDLLAAIFGGIFTGAGVAITFLGRGSTGGVDIPALILQKYAKIKVSLSSLAIDFIIIVLGLVSLKRLDLALIGIIGAVITAFVVDKVFLGERHSYIAYIISEKYEDINNFILEEMERGTTLIDVMGGYSGKDAKMIIVCFDYREYATLQDAIRKLDPKSFISIVKAHKIQGNGFTGLSEMFDKTKLDEWLENHKKIEEKEDGKE